ncbi:aminotransferase class III-fold pyridoxal phosphate-dependent enzyme [Pseudomonas sp. NPDC007930]|uniref:aspartate aminotransferase family protein n=1 Tax=Pseudomonas sp. NPDC007930 TaxID=3364417 RepID=UPI0036EC9C38
MHALPSPHALGSTAWSAEGQAYFDTTPGPLGHAHPVLMQALSEHARQGLNPPAQLGQPWHGRLAQRLCELAEAERAVLTPSACHANETALKLARLWGWYKGIGQPQVLVFGGAHHGHTLATLSASDDHRLALGGAPGESVRVPYGDLGALQAAATEHGTRIAAVWLPGLPLQGPTAAAGWLPAVAALCQRQGWLLMLDDTQVGIGRTGHWFSCQGAGVRPDVLSVAGGLSEGAPWGACLVAPRLARFCDLGLEVPGVSALACRLGWETLGVMAQQGLPARAGQAGLRQALRACFSGSGVEVRGEGLHLALALPQVVPGLARRALQEQNLLLTVHENRLIRLAPALNLSDAEAATLVAGLAALLGGSLAPQLDQVINEAAQLG